MAPLSPADAEVALRTFPRRWRALLGGLDPDDPDTEVRLHRPGPDGRSAVGAAAEAAAILEVAQGQVRQVLHSDRPTLSPGGDPVAGTLDDALDRIEAAAPALAATVAGIASGDLDRTAAVAGRTVDLRTMVADTVQEVADRLRSADRALHSRS
jgi:hypothetical protein